MSKGNRVRAMHAVEPPKADLPSTITEAELSLLKSLRDDVMAAQGVLNRYSQGLAQRYQIGQHDTLDIATGQIGRNARPRAVEEPPAS